MLGSGARSEVTFNQDVLPLLQEKCQRCHRQGEIAPMAFETYRQTRPWAQAISEAVKLKKMPPWFADPRYGSFANDPSLTQDQIRVLTQWASSGAKEGAGHPKQRTWASLWNIPKPDAVFEMPKAFDVPSSGDVDYQYFPVATGLKQDRWVRAVEVRPGSPQVVHHVVVYVREPGSTWFRGPTTRDILAIYTPGNDVSQWGEGRAKKLPAGSDLMFQIHYTTSGKAVSDRTSVGVIFAKEEPKERVLTLQLSNDRFVIPPQRADYKVLARGTLPNDATLLSLFPHMHLRGNAFEYRIVSPAAAPQVLLRVDHYDFYWQLSYLLEQPRHLAAGTQLIAVGQFDNSVNNTRNPDAAATVRYGEQSWQEMMIGFFDVAIPPWMDKESYFIRAGIESARP